MCDEEKQQIFFFGKLDRWSCLDALIYAAMNPGTEDKQSGGQSAPNTTAKHCVELLKQH